MVSISIKMCKWEDSLRRLVSWYPPRMDTCYQSKGTLAKLFPMNINFVTVSFLYWRSQATQNRNKNIPPLFIYYFWQPLIWCLHMQRSEERIVFWHFQANMRRGEATLIGFLSNMLTMKRHAFWCQLWANIHQLGVIRHNNIRWLWCCLT